MQRARERQRERKSTYRTYSRRLPIAVGCLYIALNKSVCLIPPVCVTYPHVVDGHILTVEGVVILIMTVRQVTYVVLYAY